ncbi:PqqD family protein [Hoeflea prorocentri]|uniref:PqqD family protein n=1 Tax=Hoeflea prorocentri TaxID=1922333 RepID=A0A9X3UKQ4_9HYPH|nr:PqqD family protein [Hoeflea prorocentri]MCY6382615.1 PqqD family protein [Hoeflea prorocentri]MDA5400415.1 PqqD family protein [Hoeflea prorocentri]
MTLDPQSRFKLSDKATFRSVGDNGVILNTATGQIYSCNSTAEAFLRHMDGHRDLGETADAVCGEFDIEREVLLSDLEELLTYLQSEGVLDHIDAEH